MTFTNKERAKRLGEVLRRYGTDDTDRGCLIDLLADARHWCDMNTQSFWDCDELAHQHYLAELSEEKRGL